VEENCRAAELSLDAQDMAELEAIAASVPTWRPVAQENS